MDTLERIGETQSQKSIEVVTLKEKIVSYRNYGTRDSVHFDLSSCTPEL